MVWELHAQPSGSSLIHPCYNTIAPILHGLWQAAAAPHLLSAGWWWYLSQPAPSNLYESSKESQEKQARFLSTKKKRGRKRKKNSTQQIKHCLTADGPCFPVMGYLHVCFHERRSRFHQVMTDGPVTQRCSPVEDRLPAGGPGTYRRRQRQADDSIWHLLGVQRLWWWCIPLFFL